MAIEIRTADLPKELQTAVEMKKLAVPLRENCISILEAYGVLERSRGFERFLNKIGIVAVPSVLAKDALTMEERLGMRIYRTQIKAEGIQDSLLFEIVSLGEASPRDANYLLIYVERLYGKNVYLDIGKGEPVLRGGYFGIKGINDIIGSVPAREQDLTDYSRMIVIVKENLPRRPRS